MTPRGLPSWQAACAKAGSYDSDFLSRFRVDRYMLRVPGAVLRNSLLSLIARMIPEDAHVVDFGGSTGEVGVELLQAHPHMRFTVVENATLVAMMAAIDTPVAFVEQSPADCDVFFTSGTLQYLEDPMSILRRGFESARLIVALARNSFGARETFRVQRSWLFDNGAGPVPPGYVNRKISYPHRTLVMRDVIALGEQCGFDCVASLEENSGALFGAGGRQLVFVRR